MNRVRSVLGWVFFLPVTLLGGRFLVHSGASVATLMEETAVMELTVLKLFLVVIGIGVLIAISGFWLAGLGMCAGLPRLMTGRYEPVIVAATLFVTWTVYQAWVQATAQIWLPALVNLVAVAAYLYGAAVAGRDDRAS